MTTKIKWRLANRPTPMEIISLKEAGLLKDDEAREILFSLETDEDRDKVSLQEEIKFLRDLVSKLSVSRTEIVRQIEYIEKPYVKYPWWNNYQAYCSATPLNTNLTYSGSNSLLALNTTGLSNTASVSYSSTGNGNDFSQISTF